MQSWQTIDREGKKLFKKDTTLENAYFYYGKLKDRIYIAEGYATAVSVHMLTGHRVVASGNKGTIVKTAKLLKRNIQRHRLLFAWTMTGQKHQILKYQKALIL